jgi:hypothetical protein
MKKSIKKKAEVIPNTDEVVKIIEKNYGPNPVFSSKYEIAKKLAASR